MKNSTTDCRIDIKIKASLLLAGFGYANLLYYFIFSSKIALVKVFLTN